MELKRIGHRKGVRAFEDMRNQIDTTEDKIVPKARIPLNCEVALIRSTCPIT